MSVNAIRLILLLAISLALVSYAYSECHQVYICCKRSDNDECLEYCAPFNECREEETTTENNFETMTEYNLETTTADQKYLETTTESGDGTSAAVTFAVMNGQMCRMGHKAIGGICRKLM
jgi:hypothetical protein